MSRALQMGVVANQGGGGAIAPVAQGVNGFSTDGTGSWLSIASADTTDLPAAQEMTVVSMFRIDAVPTTYEYVIAKGAGGASDRGYCIFIGSGGASIECRFFGNAPLEYSPDDPSEWVGKTFIAVATANASDQQFWLWHDGLSAPLLCESLSTPSAPTTDSYDLALGARRGATGFFEADSLTIVGAGVGYTHMSESAVDAFMQACKAAGKIVSFTGESARWNEADGAGITEDQVGSYDLTTVEDTSTIEAVAPFSPEYHGDAIPLFVALGQSNARGWDTVANFPTTPTNYQAATSAVRFWTIGTTWIDLGPRGDQDAGLELSAGRDFDAVWSDTVHVLKYAVGGTDLASDWDPDAPGTRWTNWLADLDDAQDALPDRLDTLRIRCVAWVQGESDAAVEVDANAYETNLDNFIDALKSEANARGGLWDDFLFVVARLPSFQTSAYKATVIAAQDAVAAARSDTVIIDTDALTDTDGTHYDADSLISLGHAVEDAHTNQVDQTAAAP